MKPKQFKNLASETGANRKTHKITKKKFEWERTFQFHNSWTLETLCKHANSKVCKWDWTNQIIASEFEETRSLKVKEKKKKKKSKTGKWKRNPNLVKRTDALLAGVGLKVAHDHLLYKEPRARGAVACGWVRRGLGVRVHRRGRVDSEVKGLEVGDGRERILGFWKSKKGGNGHWREFEFAIALPRG